MCVVFIAHELQCLLWTTRWTSELNFRVVSISERRGNERDCIVHLLKLHESTVEKLRALFINLFAISNFETFVGFFFQNVLARPHSNKTIFVRFRPSGFPYRTGHHLWTFKDDMKEIICFCKHFAQTDHKDQARAQDFPDFSGKMLKRLCAQGFNRLRTSVWWLAIARGGISIVLFYDKTRRAFEKEM